MLPPSFFLSTDKRQNRFFIQEVTPFLNNLIFQYTNPLPFETKPHTIHTIPLARELCDSYLYYSRYKTIEITPSQTQTVETIQEEQTQTSNIVPPYVIEYSIQQESEEFVNLFQDQQHHQLNPLYPQLPQTSDTPQLNPSETATVQNASKLSEESEPIVQNTQSITITNESNLVQFPTHHITSNQNNNPNQDKTSSTIQDNTSILSTTQTNTTKPYQDLLVKIMIHLLFHLYFQLKLTLIFLLNQVLLIHNTLIQYNFKHQLRHHLLIYKRQLILQLKVIQYKLFKQV